MHILAIDQGTTNTKALVFDMAGTIVSSASASCHTDYPQPGWAEQSAAEIWSTTQAVISEATQGLEITGIGIANQRETLVIWDAETSRPIGPAPIWQCRRTAEACARLIDAGHSDTVRELTGLGINPLFPASKLAWLLTHRPEAAELHAQGRLRAGTVDAWILWNLTGGRSFATDHSNASRTLLFDTASLDWSPRLSEIFGAPIDCLPQALPSDARFGETVDGTTSLPAGIPIHAMMGDSHAALYGHNLSGPGKVKATYGTGSSLMTLTPRRIASRSGLSGTIGWTEAGQTLYALEGNITVSAQAAAYMATMLDLKDAAALSELARTVPDNGGVHVVPAFAGLGAPLWNDDARGLVTGLSLGSSRAHIARATFEAIAHQITDVFDAMAKDLGHTPMGLSADGGGSANTFLMQLQADILGVPVQRQAVSEIGALGVGAMAAKALGLHISTPSGETQEYHPENANDERAALRSGWTAAINRACFVPRF